MSSNISGRMREGEDVLFIPIPIITNASWPGFAMSKLVGVVVIKVTAVAKAGGPVDRLADLMRIVVGSVIGWVMRWVVRGVTR